MAHSALGELRYPRTTLFYIQRGDHFREERRPQLGATILLRQAHREISSGLLVPTHRAKRRGSLRGPEALVDGRAEQHRTAAAVRSNASYQLRDMRALQLRCLRVRNSPAALLAAVRPAVRKVKQHDIFFRQVSSSAARTSLRLVCPPADSDEVAQAYRYEVARGFRDDVAHLSDLISPSGEAFWPAGSLASVKPRGQSGIATSPFFFFCGCCGHVGNAIALSKRSGMSTALRSFGRIAGFGAGSHR
ncbi:hypothetical protein ABIA06_003036 [Bradyrhizobium yuanmingense]